MDILDAIKNNVIFFDGGTGTELQKKGIDCEPVLANIKYAQEAQTICGAYINVGANIVTANTFGAYSHKHENYKELIAAAFCNARARAAIDGDKKVWIALDLGPTGLMLEPYGDVPHEEVSEIFAGTIEAGVKNGADIILIETMMDINELELAIVQAKKTGLPVFATMSFDSNGRTMYGASISDMAELAERLEVDAIGMNCGNGLDAYQTLTPELLKSTDLPVIIQPNAGLPKIEDGKISYDLSPIAFGAFMQKLKNDGVRVLGGCCGTTPAHIAEMVRMCAE